MMCLTSPDDVNATDCTNVPRWVCADPQRTAVMSEMTTVERNRWEGMFFSFMGLTRRGGESCAGS